MDYMHIVHPFEPLYDEQSQILILGSFPSVRSREQGFFYGHPRNRFWKVTAGIYQEPVPQTIEEKKEFLLHQHIALWDVIYSCDIQGSSDSSIRNAVPTDLAQVMRTAPIKAVYCNGRTSGSLYARYQQKQTGIEAVTLPSTSPANAAWNLERLMDAWRVIRETAE